MTVTLYTTSSCPYCQQEKQYLDGLGIVYTTVLLDQEAARLPEFLAVSEGFSGVPVTVIQNDDHPEAPKTVIKGFNKKSLDEIFKNLQPETPSTTQPPTSEALNPQMAGADESTPTAVAISA